MNYTKLKKLSLKAIIIFLIISAIFAIISVLSDNFFSWFQLRIWGTTIAMSMVSICLMSCAAFIEKRNKEFPNT